MFRDVTDYDADTRPWLCFDARDGILARGITHRQAMDLASGKDRSHGPAGFRRSCRVDTGQTEAEIRSGA